MADHPPAGVQEERLGDAGGPQARAVSSYVLLALKLAPRARWSVGTTVMVLVGAVLPFGGYVVDRWLARRPLGLAG